MIGVNRASRALSIVSILFLIGCQHKAYPSGKDTIESFGNGRFAVMDANGRKILYDHMRVKTLQTNIMSWRKNGDYVYLLDNTRIYTVLNILSGEHKDYYLESVPPEHQPFLPR
jgi:hypothetical protein